MKAIGLIMVVLPFVVLFIFMSYLLNWMVVTAIYLIASGLIIWMAIAERLLNKNE